MSDTTTDEKVYTSEEISQHTDRDDLWMVIKGKVYNVTSFVDEHPGGEEVLVDVGGQDATNEFLDVGHSEDAEEILEGLLVGKADPNEFSTKEAASANTTQTAAAVSQDSGSSSLIYMAIAAVVAAGAFYYLQLTK